MRNGQNTNMESTYRIKIQGLVGSSFTEWFGKITVIPQENNETLLIGQFADQAALRGLLDQLWNINFTILVVERIEANHDSNPELENERRQE